MSVSKHQVISLLINGDTPKSIAEALDIPYSTVLRHRKEYEAAKLSNTLDTVYDMDKVLVTEFLDEVVANQPLELREAASDTAKQVLRKIEGMELLNNEMELAAIALTKNIKKQAATTSEVSDLGYLADALSKIQNAFFNKNSTQVNVQNNYGDKDGQAYSSLLNDKPTDH